MIKKYYLGRGRVFSLIWLVWFNVFVLLFQSPLVKNGTENDADCKSYRDSLYRPPTSEEINSLKETENLFKSSLFRMQVCVLRPNMTPIY